LKSFKGVSGTATNYVELSQMLENYGGLAIMGPAFVLQLLSIFGIAVDINAMWW
jgi:hypothetical protein